MDFWASLEHKIYYKFEGQAPEYISRELKECADMVSALDDKMLSLNEAILECLKEGGEKPVPEKTEEVDAEIIEESYRSDKETQESNYKRSNYKKAGAVN